MSTIDERVVSLQFNNKDFEKGVSESMESLENLDDVLAALGESGGAEALDQLGDSAKGMVKSMLGIDQAEKSLRGIVSLFGQLTKFHLVNDAARQVAGFVQSITDSVNVINNASVGWGKYAEKTQAMQTITAATGKTVAEVEPTIQKLLKYVDDTSYSFTDMVGSIGKFTAQGIDLEQAELAMEGISNWAALSGQGIAQANSAMYNLAQSLAMGSVKLQDWKSIENANMATKEFKEAVIELAKAEEFLSKEGKTAKGTLVDYQNFSQTLSEGWFTSDLLIKVLGKFADREDELGEKAFNAAMQATTFQQAIDAVKDTATTGWLQTWELMFGNLDEAIDLWTNFATALQKVVGYFAEARNAVLRGWNILGGRNDIIEGVTAVWETFLEIGEEIADVFNDIFNPFDEIIDKTTEYADAAHWAVGIGEELIHVVRGDGQNVFGAFSLKNITEGIRDFGQNVKKWFNETIEVGGKTATRIDLIGNAARTVFTIIGTVAKSIGRAIGTITKAIGYLQPIFDSILKIIGDSDVAEFFTDLFNSESAIQENANFWEFFAKTIQFVADTIDDLWAGLKQLVKALGLDQIFANLLNFDFNLSSWNSITGWIMDAVRWVQGVGGAAWGVIMDFLFGEEQTGSLLDVAAGKGKKRSGGIVGAVANFWNDLNGENGAWTNIVAWFDTAISWITETGSSAWNSIISFLFGNSEGESNGGTSKSEAAVGGIVGQISNWYESINKEDGIWTKLKQWFADAKAWVLGTGAQAWSSIMNFLFGEKKETIYGGDSASEDGERSGGLFGKISSWYTSVGGASGIWESIKTWFTNAFSWVTTAGNIAWTAITNFLFGTADEETGVQTGGIISKLSSWWNGSEGKVGAWESIKTWFTNAFTWVKTAGKIAFDAIRDFLFGTTDEETGTQTAGIVQKIGTWWNGSEGQVGAWDSIKTWFTNAFSWVKTAGATAFNAIRDFLFGTTDEETGTQTKGIVQKIGDWWNGLDGEDGAWAGIKKWFTDASTWVSETASGLWSTIVGFFTGSDGETSSEGTAKSGGILSGISDWWNGTATSRSAWESIVTWAGGVIDWLTTTGAELWTSLLNWFSGGSGNSATSVINESTANVAGQAFGSLVSAIGGASEAADAAGSVSSGAEDNTTGLTGFCDSIIGWLNSNSSGITTAVPVVESLSALLTSVFNLIFTIVEDIAIFNGTKGIFKAGKETIKSWNKFAKEDDSPKTFADYFMEFAKAIGIISLCIAGIFALNEINPSGLDKALGVIGGIAAVLLILSIVFYNLGKQEIKTDFGEMLFNFAKAVGILAVVIAVLSFFDPGKIIATALGVLVFVGILVAIETIASQHTGKNKVGGLESVAWATVILMIPVLILYAMSTFMDGAAWGRLIESAAFILVFAFALAMIGALSSKLAGENKLSGLIQLAFALVLLMVPLLIVYTMIRTDHAGELAGAIVAIVVMLGVLAAAAISISKFATNIGATIAVFVVMGLLLAEFGVIVDSMKAIPSDVIWGIAGGFSVMMAVMAGIVAAFSALPTGGLFIGIAAIALLGAAFEGLIALGAVVAEMASEKISNAVDNIQTIVEKVSAINWDEMNIPNNAKRSISNLVDILTNLSAGALTTTVLDFITEFVGGTGASTDGMLSQIDRLKLFGEGIADFAKNVSAASSNELHNATLAADLGKMLQELDQALIQGGQNRFDALINGEKGLLPFTEKLGQVGQNFAAFATATANVDSKSAMEIGTSIKHLSEAAAAMTQVGNVGDVTTKISTLVDGLSSIDIDALKAFSDKAAGSDYNGINTFSSSIMNMKNMLEEVWTLTQNQGNVSAITYLNTFIGDLNSIDIAAFLEKETDFYDAGESTGTFYTIGLKDGVQSAQYTTALTTAASTVAQSIDTEVRKTLGINSPSTLATQSGAFYTAGLTDGITQGESTVGDAADSLCQTLQGPFDSLKTYFDNFSLFGKDPVTGQEKTFEDMFSGIFGENGFDVNSMFGLKPGETLLDKLGFNMEDLKTSMGITGDQDFSDVMGIPEGGFAEMIGLGKDSGGLAGIFGLTEGQTLTDVMGIPEGGFAEMIGLGASSGGLAGIFGLSGGKTISDVLGIPEGGIASMLQLPEGGITSLFGEIPENGLFGEGGLSSFLGEIPEGGVPAMLGIPEGGLQSLFTFGNNPDGSAKGLGDLFDFSSISEQMGSIFSTDPNAEGGIMSAIQSFVAEASTDITDGLTLSPVITPVLDMSNITGNKIFGGAFTKDGKLKTPVLSGTTGGPVAAMDLAGKVLYSRNETSSDRDLLSRIADSSTRTANSLTNKTDSGIVRAINNLPEAIAVALEGLTVTIDGEKVGDASSGRVGENLNDGRGRILGGFGRPRY